jgi:hypothetical protein
MFDIVGWRSGPGSPLAPETYAASFDSRFNTPDRATSQDFAEVWLRNRFGLPALRARVVAEVARLGGGA